LELFGTMTFSIMTLSIMAHNIIDRIATLIRMYFIVTHRIMS
jgi:hypothetical protein